MEFKDYYQTLGVEKSATDAEIKKAFRQLARQYHPDVADDKVAAEERFKEINEAYEVLGDPEKRSQYDSLGQDWQRGAAASGSGGYPRYEGSGSDGASSYQEFHFDGTGFSDFFEQYFGGKSRATHGFPGGSHYYQDTGYGGRQAMRGRDIEGDLMVTLDEALRGTERELSLQWVDPETGRTEPLTFTVRIPQGATEGRRIRVPGKGGPGMNGGPSGDLFLRIRFAAHPDFRSKGSDLYYDLELTPAQAVLGTETIVKTLDGSRVKVKIPPGTQHDQQLRLKGRGLPVPNKDESGDLYVNVQIQIPTSLTPEQRAAWEQLAAVHP